MTVTPTGSGKPLAMKAHLRYALVMRKPLPTGESPQPQPVDVTSNEYFMGEALRLATMAYETDEFPIGAVIVCSATRLSCAS
jgi:hypothetical protein